MLNKAIEEHPERGQRAILTWKDRDKLTSAFLLTNPGPGTNIGSQVFAEGMATYLCLPSRVCADRVGERVGKSTVDSHGLEVSQWYSQLTILKSTIYHGSPIP